MILAHRVALNGVQLDELDERINIKGIEEGAGKDTISASSMYSGMGQRITNKHRDTLDIKVKFSMLIEPEQLPERSVLLEKINAWAAGGGWLTLNYRPGRRVGVILAQAPGAGDQYEWTSVYTITFRAYSIPYWEDETAISQTFGGSSASGSRNIQIDGSAETQADVELANTSGMVINTASVSVGGKTMAFTSLGLRGGEVLVIDHSDGLVRIRIRNGGSYRSVMAARSVSSANDLLISPGVRSASYSADRACRMTVSWRARYL